jgi:hypothetical protein
MKQLTNSALNSGTNLSDSDFENYIAYHLAIQTKPNDLSNNDFSKPNSMTISDPSLNNQNVIINNNDTLLVNENFALKVNYKPETIVSYDNYSYSIGGGSHISTNVYLNNTTGSLYDSNLKIDISFNSDVQYTDDNVWGVKFDRNNTGMNYFACINSKLEAQDNTSPFYILENSANIYSLGNNPETVSNGGAYYGTHKYFTRDSSNVMIPQNISTNYTLDANFCRSELDNDISSNGAGSHYNGIDISNSGHLAPTAYSYNDSEFNTFKIVQDQPHVVNYLTNNNSGLDVSGSQTPIQYNGADIDPNTFDISGIFNSQNNENWNNIGSGFQISVLVGNNQDGGYSIDSYNYTSAFSIDDSNLTRDVANPYMQINVQNTDHYLHIENGSLSISSANNTGNTDYINIDNTLNETLGQSFYNVSGEIVVFTKDVNNRVYYPNNGGQNGFSDVSGIKSSLTDYVNVYYNNSEASGKSTLNNYVKQLDTVEYSVSVKSSSTSDIVLSSDNRNLAKNNSALLALVSNDSNVNLYDISFVLQSNLPTDPSYIQIVSLENKSVLTDNKPIVDISENTISGSTSSVNVQNINLEGLNYVDYRVYLTTKTVSDISNLLQLKNNWSVTTNDPLQPVMIGNALKTGVIRDDYLFMTNASNGNGQGDGLDISMTYAFQVASPVIANTQAVKHQIAISFLDLASNTTYDATETVFYLDDQDISLNPIGSPVVVEDASCTDITNSSLNNGNYNASNYIFKKFTSTKQFNASFDSKFQFYTNLRFVTPTIYEQSVYYQIYDLNSVQLPSYLLKYFQCNNSGNILSNTYVNLVDSNGNNKTYSTNFNLTQEVTSIFNVELYGSNNSVNYVPVPGTQLSYLDPFFNYKATIQNFDGQNAIGTVSVNIGNNNIVNKSQYYIQADNAPGVNVSFNAKKYIYTVGTTDPVLNNFSFYNNFYNNSNLVRSTTCDVVLDACGNSNVIRISDGTGLLATVIHPSAFIDNYNIVVCSSPLFQVTGNYIDSFYTLAVNNTVQVDNGVYYYNTPNPSVGMSDRFALISDSFSLKFVNDVGFDNGQYSTRTLFTQSNIDTWLTNPYTRSFKFDLVRGYSKSGSIVGTNYRDVITITRRPSIYKFYLDGISSQNSLINNQVIYQTFTGVYHNQVFTVDNISGIPAYPGLIYNLGLTITANYSMLSVDEYNLYHGNYNIIARVANYTASILSNPYQPQIIGSISSGYLTDIETAGSHVGTQKDLLYPYITGIQAACIKSYGAYRLLVERDVPDLKVYSLINKRFIGDPAVLDASSGVWFYEGPVSYNNFLWTGFTLSNLNVRRLAETGTGGNTVGHVVFYNSYYAYYVVAPPSINIYGYPVSKNITSVPITGTPSFFTEFDIVQSNTYIYTISNGIDLSFQQPTPFSFAHYLFTANTKYRFNIKGNKISIALYNGGVANFGEENGPDTIDRNSLPWERFYSVSDNICIENLQNISNYFRVTLDSSLNYNIDYKQLIFNPTHNSTENIHFSIGNAFTGPNSDNASGNPSYYLRLPVAFGTNASFYQANIIYADVSGSGYYDGSGNHIGHIDLSFGTGYYMIIDRYDTDSNVNYNAILQTQTIREYFFPVQSHRTKEIFLGSIVDQNGNVIHQQDYLNQIELSDISNSSWTIDSSFTLQYVGITLSGLSNSGINAIGDLFKYDSLSYTQSKSLYVRRQDAIRMTNVLGNTTFRVTNSGNVQTQRVLTSNISLYYPPTSVKPNQNSIAGSSDIITIFAQDTIMDV